MATGSDEQPVLLTEGEFVTEDNDKPSENQDASESQQPQQESNGSASADAPETPAEKQEQAAETPRPSTAPEANGVADGSLKNVERSVLNAISASQSPFPSAGDDVGGGGDDAEETLSAKLEQVPSEAGDRDEEYVAPPEDPYMRAVNYMERHKVMQIFQKLTAEIVYHRPPDPLDHMLGELQKMKKERDANIDAIISSASSKGQSSV